MANKDLRIFLSSLKSFFFSLMPSADEAFTKNIILIKTEKAWARTVAKAAPAAPSLNGPIKSQSRKMFTRQARAIKISGVLESPSPL